MQARGLGTAETAPAPRLPAAPPRQARGDRETDKTRTPVGQAIRKGWRGAGVGRGVLGAGAESSWATAQALGGGGEGGGEELSESPAHWLLPPPEGSYTERGKREGQGSQRAPFLPTSPQTAGELQLVSAGSLGRSTGTPDPEGSVPAGSQPCPGPCGLQRHPPTPQLHHPGARSCECGSADRDPASR